MRYDMGILSNHGSNLLQFSSKLVHVYVTLKLGRKKLKVHCCKTGYRFNFINHGFVITLAMNEKVLLCVVDDDMGDMPTPERLVTEDMLPNRYEKPVGGEMDNKVANFLAVCSRTLINTGFKYLLF